MDLVQAFGQFNGDAPGVDDHRGGDVVHGGVAFLVRAAKYPRALRHISQRAAGRFGPRLARPLLFLSARRRTSVGGAPLHRAQSRARRIGGCGGTVSLVECGTPLRRTLKHAGDRRRSGTVARRLECLGLAHFSGRRTGGCGWRSVAGVHPHRAPARQQRVRDGTRTHFATAVATPEGRATQEGGGRSGTDNFHILIRGNVPSVPRSP